jgi:hypothetical protein
VRQRCTAKQQEEAGANSGKAPIPRGASRENALGDTGCSVRAVIGSDWVVATADGSCRASETKRRSWRWRLDGGGAVEAERAFYARRGVANLPSLHTASLSAVLGAHVPCPCGPGMRLRAQPQEWGRARRAGEHAALLAPGRPSIRQPPRASTVRHDAQLAKSPRRASSV